MRTSMGIMDSGPQLKLPTNPCYHSRDDFLFWAGNSSIGTVFEIMADLVPMICFLATAFPRKKLIPIPGPQMIIFRGMFWWYTKVLSQRKRRLTSMCSDCSRMLSSISNTVYFKTDQISLTILLIIRLFTTSTVIFHDSLEVPIQEKWEINK